MKIAVAHDTVYPFFKGGSPKRAYEISRRLVKRGHEVHWYGMDYGASEIEGIRLHAVCPEYRLYTREGRRIVTQAIKYGARLNIREKVDIIDCTNFPYLHCFRAKMTSRIQRVPLVITWFEFWGDYWYEYMKGKELVGFAGKSIERMISRFPDLIIADSEKVKKQLVDVKVNAGKIRVIPDGADIEAISSAEPSKEKYDVVYVGRIVAHKKVDVLIRAMAGLKDVTMAVIGDGQNRVQCEALSVSLGAEKRIKFYGHVPEDRDVYAIIKSSKVLVIPSVQEGHPHVIPEANACGIPVIGIKGICDEFIHHGETGYLSELNELQIAELITRAIELYPKFELSCVMEAKRYDWDLLTDEVESAYRELV